MMLLITLVTAGSLAKDIRPTFLLSSDTSVPLTSPSSVVDKPLTEIMEKNITYFAYNYFLK